MGYPLLTAPESAYDKWKTEPDDCYAEEREDEEEPVDDEPLYAADDFDDPEMADTLRSEMECDLMEVIW